jgi:DNA-directed RNA polymerase subunit RPC12/RpoP
MMDTSSVQYTLRTKDLQKASSLLELPLEQLQHFNNLKLLNVVYIRSLLMRADFERLTNGLHYLSKGDKKYNFPEVVKALAREYGVSTKSVAHTLSKKDESIYFCAKCGIRITASGMRDRGGLCPNCYSDTLEF